jgi:hypothetical protein
MNKSESIAKIAAAVLKAQKAMGAAMKDSKNPFFKSKYADLNSVIDAGMPALHDNGVSVLQAQAVVEGNPFVETILLHESGEWMSSLTPIIVAKDNDPQALGSAISYARRYGLQSFLTLKAEDDDGEAAMGRNDSVSKVSTSFKPKASVGF